MTIAYEERNIEQILHRLAEGGWVKGKAVQTDPSVVGNVVLVADSLAANLVVFLVVKGVELSLASPLTIQLCTVE